MQTGIIGLPQVGKTTLFKILTKANLDARAGQAATHVGIARVPEPRLVNLAEIFKPKKITYATIEYADVGGLVTEKVRDAEDLDLELMLADLDQITRRLERLEKDLKKKKEATLENEQTLLLRCKKSLETTQALRELEFTNDERKMLTGFKFLSQRPMLYVLNVGDDEVGELDVAVEKHKLGTLASKPNTAVVAICGRIEAELAELDDVAAAELLSAYGLKSPGLDRVIEASYKLLGLTSFFTAGEPEVRAWTIKQGMNAQKAAGTIISEIGRASCRERV